MRAYSVVATVSDRRRRSETDATIYGTYIHNSLTKKRITQSPRWLAIQYAFLLVSFFWRVSSRLWFSALVGRQEQRPPSGQAPAGHFSCGQLLVGDSLPRYRINETGKPFQCVARNIALVQPEGKLVKRSGQDAFR